MDNNSGLTALPEWLTTKDDYLPPQKGGSFVYKTINSLGRVMSRVKTQQGHEKKYALPAIFKLLLLILLILTVSITHSLVVILSIFAAVMLYLSTWPGRDIAGILKSAFAAAFLAFILILPAMLLKPSGAGNNLMLVFKVFLSVEMLNIFNHTTVWNHITHALRCLHLPKIFIFTLDITLKYIVLSGQLIQDLLRSVGLRSVGKNNKEYNTVGGVMGNTFIRSALMSREMYNAMRCRGFTDDYKGL